MNEQEIRSKDTKDLTISELGEKIRIVSKEISQFDSDLIKQTREIYDIHCKRDKRNKYLAILRNDLKLRKSKRMLSELDEFE